MPSENRVRGDDGRDFAEQATADLLALRSEPAALIIVEPKTAGTDLLPQDPILFAQVVEDLLLFAVQPSGEAGE